MSDAAEPTPAEPTTLQDLGEDLLATVFGHLCSLHDLASGARVCRVLAAAAATEVTFEPIARRLYPADTLAGSPYPTWRALVQDDNAHGGAWGLRLCVQTDWNYNNAGLHPLWYTNRLLGMWYEPASTAPLAPVPAAPVQRARVRVLVEAWGEADLRDTHTSVLFLKLKAQPGQRTPIIIRRLMPVRYEYHVRTVGHHVCSLFFDVADSWSAGAELYFNFNGCTNLAGSDYPCRRVLTIPDGAPTARRLFCGASRALPPPQGCERRFEDAAARARRWPAPLWTVAAFDSAEAGVAPPWLLPAPILRRLEGGQWGC